MMYRFLKEFELSTHSHELPQQCLDLVKLMENKREPTLQGSLRYTAQAHWCQPIDPRQVKDWRTPENSILKLPKTHVQGSFSSSYLDELKVLYTVLYPHEDHISVNSMIL